MCGPVAIRKALKVYRIPSLRARSLRNAIRCRRRTILESAALTCRNAPSWLAPGGCLKKVNRRKSRSKVASHASRLNFTSTRRQGELRTRVKHYTPLCFKAVSHRPNISIHQQQRRRLDSGRIFRYILPRSSQGHARG